MRSRLSLMSALPFYGSCSQRQLSRDDHAVAPNNSFKPNLLRYTKAMAERACHGFGSTTQVGLTQVLGITERFSCSGLFTLLSLPCFWLFPFSAPSALASLPAFRWATEGSFSYCGPSPS